MGAAEFTHFSKGASADKAFRAAQDEARYENGHGGYTGTIAEKDSFKMVTPREGETPQQCVDRLMEDENWWGQDKWGPAACIHDEGRGGFLFFGWASS